ncbi:MAG: hypothetical protein R3199_09670 [Gemmatimonadota bacterium]|nr:hypothetical protein [Gemmatimonadota bacterium]
MSTRKFPPLLAVLALIALAAPASAQEPASEEREAPGFERKYIDASAYRGDPVLLRDWPALSRTLQWTRRLEAAVAQDDRTLSADLIEGFRARIDSLERSPRPAFLETRADSVDTALGSIRARLDSAEASLAALPPEAKPTGEEADNAPDRQRTLVTGNTAVTVPAGVRVGEADTLPAAELEGEPENFVDHLALALAGLDRLVHLVRTAGPDEGSAREPRAGRAPERSPRRAPPRPAP